MFTIVMFFFVGPSNFRGRKLYEGEGSVKFVGFYHIALDLLVSRKGSKTF